MFILAFEAFYKSDPSAFPMTFSQLVSYIWIQQAFLAMFHMYFWESEVINSISSGSIAYELVRPMSLYGRWYCQSYANRLSRTLLRCVPMLVIASLLPQPYRLSLPPDIAQFMLFVPALFLSTSVTVAVSMFLYISMFYTISMYGLRTMMGAVTDFLSGAVVPLVFFPPVFRDVVEFLPFGAMMNMPLRVYIGDIYGVAALRGIGLQIVWLVVLVTLGQMLMSRAVRKVVVQGG
jgi:ABC-2 type transport system permease protein